MTSTELKERLKALKRRISLVAYIWLGCVTLGLFGLAEADRPLLAAGVFIPGLIGMVVFLRLSLHGWAKHFGCYTACNRLRDGLWASSNPRNGPNGYSRWPIRLTPNAKRASNAPALP